MGAIASWLGMDPTTLNRNLRRLLALRLVRDGRDPRDGWRRPRRGRAKLREGLPLCRDALAAAAPDGGEPAALEADRLNCALARRRAD